MTGVLVVYSATFMRYSMAVTPKNYLLFACHFVNSGAQMVQGYRWLGYWKQVALFHFALLLAWRGAVGLLDQVG
jgi:hypothetical protein